MEHQLLKMENDLFDQFKHTKLSDWFATKLITKLSLGFAQTFKKLVTKWSTLFDGKGYNYTQIVESVEAGSSIQVVPATLEELFECFLRKYIHNQTHIHKQTNTHGNSN